MLQKIIEMIKKYRFVWNMKNSWNTKEYLMKIYLMLQNILKKEIKRFLNVCHEISPKTGLIINHDWSYSMVQTCRPVFKNKWLITMLY